MKPQYNERPRHWQNNLVVSVPGFSFIKVLYHLQRFTIIGAKNAARCTALYRGLYHKCLTIYYIDIHISV